MISFLATSNYLVFTLLRRSNLRGICSEARLQEFLAARAEEPREGDGRMRAIIRATRDAKQETDTVIKRQARFTLDIRGIFDSGRGDLHGDKCVTSSRRELLAGRAGTKPGVIEASFHTDV